MRKKRHREKRFLGKKVMLALSLVLLVFIVWGFMGEFYRAKELESEITDLQAKADELRNTNEELSSLKERLKGEGELEREARLKLNLQKPGEEVMVIQGDPGLPEVEPNVASAPEVEESRPDTNVHKWWYFFFPQNNKGNE